MAFFGTGGTDAQMQRPPGGNKYRINTEDLCNDDLREEDTPTAAGAPPAGEPDHGHGDMQNQITDLNRQISELNTQLASSSEDHAKEIALKTQHHDRENALKTEEIASSASCTQEETSSAETALSTDNAACATEKAQIESLVTNLQGQMELTQMWASKCR